MSASTEPRTGLLRDVRDAVAGKSRDYTREPIQRAVLLLAVPMVLEMFMQSLFSVADIFFVGRLGPAAVAVVGLTDSLLAIVFSAAIGVSIATTAMVARRIGEGAPDRAATAAVQAIGLGVLLSLPVAIAGFTSPTALLRLLGADETVAGYGSNFTAIMLAGNVSVVLLFLLNAIFRGAGDASVAMRSLWIANSLNIVLDPLFIFGLGPIPAMGLEGAAIATTLARFIGVAYQLYRLAGSGGNLQIRRDQILLVPAVLLRLVRVSAIGVVQFLVSTTSFIWLFRILSGFGADAMAGYTIAIRIIMFILLPAWGMGNAAATLVGQNLGAQNPERAERAVWITARANTIFLGLIGVVLFFFAEPIAGIFSAEAAVIEVAALCLRTVSYSYLFWGFGMVTVLAFNGSGDTTTPTWLNLIAYWVVQLPLAWILSGPRGLGPQGVFIAIATGQIVIAILGVTFFRRGRWKTREI